MFSHSTGNDVYYSVADRLVKVRLGGAAVEKRVFFVDEGIFGRHEHGKAITTAATGLNKICRADGLVPWYH